MLLALLTVGFSNQPVSANPAVIVVPDDYPTIQEAINNANEGDTINVSSGVYFEHIVVNKSLTLSGENGTTTIIHGSGSGVVVSVIADRVKISDFTIGFSIFGVGIKFSNSSKNNVKNCIIFNNGIGISLDGSSNTTVADCSFDLNVFEAVYLDSSFENRIMHSNITSSSNYGIYSMYSCNNTILNCEVYSNNNYGIYLSSFSLNNRILDCRIHSNGDDGVWFWRSGNNLIENCYISDNGDSGVDLQESSNNTIASCRLSSNSDGVLFYPANNNTLMNCDISHNIYGIRGMASSNNEIYHNNFVNNTYQTYLNVPNPSFEQWDNGYPSGGNYWSDHNPPDIYSGPYQNETSRDGIGDLPYIIDGNNTDRYPLIYPYGYVPSPDVNEDGIVDIVDIVVVALAFGTKPGSPDWNSIADINQDGEIDIVDIVMIAIHFGEEW